MRFILTLLVGITLGIATAVKAGSFNHNKNAPNSKPPARK